MGCSVHGLWPEGLRVQSLKNSSVRVRSIWQLFREHESSVPSGASLRGLGFGARFESVELASVK